MRLFADECVYRVTIEALRSWGHVVDHHKYRLRRGYRGASQR
ncbi:MAG: hypothetical protein ACE5HA_03480 [Anaerolineae bacterium]